MFVEIKNTLRRLRGQILGWGIGLAIYSLLMALIYEDISAIDFSAFIDYYPEEMLAFFGDSILALSSPSGYLDLYFFNYMTVIVGILAVSTGAKLLAKDEEDGLLDLILSYPVSRTGIFWGRVIGSLVSLMLILAIAWLSWIIPSGIVGMELTAIDLLQPFLPLFSQLLLFGSFAMLLSLLLPSSRMASMISGGLLVGNYLLVGLANINQNLQDFVKYTPLHYYQGGKAIEGLNQDWLIVVFEGIVLLVLLAWWRFLERDLRVAGEGSWQVKLPKLPKILTEKLHTLKSLKAPLNFIGQRLIFGLLVLTFISYASFVGLDMARGESFQTAAYQGIRKTIDYAVDALQGDFGETSSGSVSLLPKPVIEVVPTVLARSLGLLGISIAVAALLGVILGVLIAGKRSGVTLLALLGSIMGVSIPSFFAALLLQIGVIKLTQLYGKALLPVGGFGWDKHLILPTIVLAARPLAQITRVTFVTVEEILSNDYVRTAYSKGLTTLRVTVVHIIRNAAVPVLTTIGLSLRFALSSLPIVEYFFGWQGLGFTLLQSISNRDDKLTIILVLCLGLLFILINLLLDGAYLLIDPRLRTKADKVSLRESLTLAERYRKISVGIQSLLEEPPWKRWFNRGEDAQPSPFTELVESRDDDFSYINVIEQGKERARIWLAGTLGNPALIFGTLIVLVLMVVILFSPQISPHSPYTTQGMTIVDGVFNVPPFAPDEEYPWGSDPLGRDIMSLIFAGAQQTFSLAFSVVAVRLVIGFFLGSIIGWFKGSLFDRLILGVAEIISAFPALLLVMVLILAIGIRQGMMPFVIALSFVGWSEIMQYVRSRVMEIKPKLFIESASAAGAGSGRIIWKHIFPNIIPGLISILSLEVGAVLMLLGELGFIGIFIGGGAFAELEIFGPPFHYADIPEWGALLSNIRIYARSYPWTALYPAGAFFIAITGFNLLGEGIRRLVEKVGVAATRVFVNKYTLAVGALLIVVFFWFRGSTGSIAVFTQQAKTFDGQQAMEHLEKLTDPAWQGRALGSDGLQLAAEYIADEFQEGGLQPAGESMTYFQTRPRSFEALDTIPYFSIEDASYRPIYHQDYVEYVGLNRNLGTAVGKVRFLGMGNLMVIGQWSQNFPALDGLDYSSEIVMVLSDQDAMIINDIPKAGLLVVTKGSMMLSRIDTLSSRDSFFDPFGSTDVIGGDTPILRISEKVANHLLADTGYQLEQLRYDVDKLKQDELLEVETNKSVTIKITGTVFEKEEAVHVIGHLPGVKGAPQAQMDNQLIVILAQYDTPPLLGGEARSAGANDNASGVAVMLEMIRTMRESGYQPNKTFLFIAYSGEGLEGGEWVTPDISKFLQTKYGFSTSFNLEAVIEIRGVGAGAGDGLLLSTEGSLRLVNLFEDSAKRMRIPVNRAESWVDLGVIFQEGFHIEPADEAPYLGVFWEGWWEPGGTDDDYLETISVDYLQQAGEMISLASMVIGQEIDY